MSSKRRREEEEELKVADESACSKVFLPPPEKPTHHGGETGPNLTMQLVAVDDYINATKARAQFNVTGRGQLVAVLDSGLYAEHEDFKGRVVPGKNFSDGPGDESKTADPYGEGHGTNVSGIICANGSSNIPSNMEHVGIAPGASIMPFKVFGKSSNFMPIQRSLEWIIKYNDSKPAMPVTAVSMSLGDTRNYTVEPVGDYVTIIRRLIQTLRGQRVPVLIAAGNDFFPNLCQPGMSFPAIIRECISVGAVYDKVIADPDLLSYASGAKATSAKPGQITPFSQRLHMRTAPETYTKVFAPGAPVVSTGFGDGNVLYSAPHDPVDGWSTMNGTSQATPVVTGIVLLLQELWKRHTGELPTVDQILYCLVTDRTVVDEDLGVDNVKHTGLSYPVVFVPSILAKAAARLSAIASPIWRPLITLRDTVLMKMIFAVKAGHGALVAASASGSAGGGGSGSGIASASASGVGAPTGGKIVDDFDYKKAASESAAAAATSSTRSDLGGCVSAVEEALATCRSRSANISVQGRALTTKEHVQLQALQDATSKLAEALRILQV